MNWHARVALILIVTGASTLGALAAQSRATVDATRSFDLPAGATEYQHLWLPAKEVRLRFSTPADLQLHVRAFGWADAETFLVDEDVVGPSTLTFTNDDRGVVTLVITNLKNVASGLTVSYRTNQAPDDELWDLGAGLVGAGIALGAVSATADLLSRLARKRPG